MKTAEETLYGTHPEIINEHLLYINPEKAISAIKAYARQVAEAVRAECGKAAQDYLDHCVILDTDIEQFIK